MTREHEAHHPLLSFRSRRIFLVAGILALLSVPALTAVNTYLYETTSQERQDAKIARNQSAALAAEVKAQDAYIAGQKAAQHAQCVAGIHGVIRANVIIRGLRASLLDLSVAATNPKIARLLHERAMTFKTFARPDCSSKQSKPRKG